MHFLLGKYKGNTLQRYQIEAAINIYQYLYHISIYSNFEMNNTCSLQLLKKTTHPKSKT